MKSKINIVKTKPVVTDEEIQGFMNFDGLLKDVNQQKKRSRRSAAIKITSVVIGVLILGLLTYEFGFKNQSQPNEEPEPKSIIESSPRVDTTQTSPPLNKVDSVVNLSEPKKEIVRSTLEKEQLIKSESVPAKEIESKTIEPIIKKSDSVSMPLTPKYVKAEPVNGFPDLYEYFRIELQYPESAVKDSISGVVMVSFMINREGKPEHITVLNSLGPAFDEEVLRLIENMPAWKPATRDGIPIPSKISMPLTFKYQRIKVK